MTQYSAPNGMNLSRSMNRPYSRANMVLDYLHTVGPASRAEIIRDVFDRTVVDTNRLTRPRRKGEVTRGWGAYLFALLKWHGYIRGIRTGNHVRYEVV
jgi:hypothetical protein